MIYFIQAVDGGAIKIGTTRRMTRRVKSYSTHTSGEHLVLGVANGNHKEERAIHKRFASLRGKGEWFHPGDELLRYIKENTTKWDGADDSPSVRKTTLVKIHSDLYKMARVVAAFTDQKTETVIEDAVREGLEDRYRKVLAKAVREAGIVLDDK